MLGATHVARAAPDGYTIAVAGTTELAVAISTRRNLGYDPRRDFAPLAMLVDVPQWIVGSPQIEARSLADLVSAARRQPGRLTFVEEGPAFTVDIVRSTADSLHVRGENPGGTLEIVFVPAKRGRVR